PDAVILSSSRVDDGVEIVAAIDFDETVLSSSAAVASAQPPSQSSSPDVSSSPLDDMRQEIQTLRSMLEAQLRGHPGQGEPLHSLLLQKLIYLGVSQMTASSLVNRISPSVNQQRGWKDVLHHLSS